MGDVYLLLMGCLFCGFFLVLVGFAILFIEVDIKEFGGLKQAVFPL